MSYRFLSIILSVVSLFLDNPLQALTLPQKSPYDGRIRVVAYNPEDVVQVETVIGITTHIILEDGETYLTHAFGDSDAYAFAVSHHHLFLKPRAEDAHTNLVVVTNQRSYNFRLNCHDQRQNERNRMAVYQVQFQYPESDARRYRERAEQAGLEKGFQQQGRPYNLSYTMSGDTAIAPIHVWDDGRFTYFKLRSQEDFPVIYMVDADGRESLVNRHMAGRDQNIVVLHKVHDRWVLRLGEQALAIYNEAKSPCRPLPHTGTASMSVERAVKEHLKDKEQ